MQLLKKSGKCFPLTSFPMNTVICKVPLSSVTSMNGCNHTVFTYDKDKLFRGEQQPQAHSVSH